MAFPTLIWYSPGPLGEPCGLGTLSHRPVRGSGLGSERGGDAMSSLLGSIRGSSSSKQAPCATRSEALKTGGIRAGDREAVGVVMAEKAALTTGSTNAARNASIEPAKRKGRWQEKGRWKSKGCWRVEHKMRREAVESDESQMNAFSGKSKKNNHQLISRYEM